METRRSKKARPSAVGPAAGQEQQGQAPPEGVKVEERRLSISLCDSPSTAGPPPVGEPPAARLEQLADWLAAEVAGGSIFRAVGFSDSRRQLRSSAAHGAPGDDWLEYLAALQRLLAPLGTSGRTWSLELSFGASPWRLVDAGALLPPLPMLGRLVWKAGPAALGGQGGQEAAAAALPLLAGSLRHSLRHLTSLQLSQCDLGAELPHSLREIEIEGAGRLLCPLGHLSFLTRLECPCPIAAEGLPGGGGLWPSSGPPPGLLSLGLCGEKGTRRLMQRLPEPSLPQLTALTHLRLERCGLGAELEACLEPLQQLAHLELDSCRHYDAPVLGLPRLLALTCLSIHGGNKGLESIFICNLPALREVEVGGCRHLESAVIRGLPHLEIAELYKLPKFKRSALVRDDPKAPGSTAAHISIASGSDTDSSSDSSGEGTGLVMSGQDDEEGGEEETEDSYYSSDEGDEEEVAAEEPVKRELQFG